MPVRLPPIHTTLLVTLQAVALAACSAKPEPAGQPPAVSFATVSVTAVSRPNQVKWDGVVEAVDQATLSAQTAGRVLELPFDVNDSVKAGQVLVRFTDVEQVSGQRRASAGLSAAQAELRDAQAAFRRAEELLGRQLIARAAFDQAKARREAAQAALAAAQASVREAGEQVDYTVIRAPYSGILTERFVKVGESVRPGQPLVAGLSLSKLRVQVDVPQRDVAAIRQHAKAAVVLDDGRSIAAEKVIVFPSADPQTHSVKVRVELPEAETGLQPGMTVKVAFTIGESPRLLVPASAIFARSEVSAVYVVDGNNRVGLRQLRLGGRFGDDIEILAGLQAGERIAADPLAALATLSSERGDD